jgi:DNA-binding transcriptional MerR regulator
MEVRPMASKNTFSIGQVAEMTGATVRQVRRWTDSGVIIPAERQTHGDISYRRYTSQHVESISRIMEYLNQGYTLSFASKIVKKEGRKDA